MRLSFLALLVFLPLSLSANTLVLGVHDNYTNPEMNLSAYGEGYRQVFSVEDCPELDSQRLKEIQRITMDIMLICNAVKRAHIADKIQLVPYPNVSRGIKQSINGQTDMIAQTLFNTDHKGIPDLLVSQAVIRQGEFQVGIFTTRNRKEILKAKTAEDFQQLRGVTVKSWKTDQKAIKNIGAKELSLLPSRDLLARFIRSGRADFTLSYLKEPIVTRIGGELIRIPGVKVSFPESRSFIVPARNKALFAAINDYISTLRTEQPDAVRQAYIHAGFITEMYDSWLDLGLINAQK